MKGRKSVEQGRGEERVELNLKVGHQWEGMEIKWRGRLGWSKGVEREVRMEWRGGLESGHQNCIQILIRS